MTEEKKEEYLAKLKFIEKINGYKEDWVSRASLTCGKYCAPACRNNRNQRLRYSVNTKNIKESSNNVDGTCVEFLRHPKKT